MASISTALGAKVATVDVQRFLGRFGIYLAIILVAAIFAVLKPVFLSPDNIANIGRQVTLLTIAAFGMTFVILAGEIDISVGAIASMSSVIIASMLSTAMPWPLAVLAGVAAGAFVGAFNGVLTVKGQIPSFIVTLGALNVVRGLSLAATSASTIIFKNDVYRDIFARSAPLGIPSPVWLAVSLFLVLGYVLHRTKFGADIFAVGGNAQLARLAGIASDRVKIWAFVLCGAIAAFSATVLTARVGNGQPEGAIGLELDAIAAVVLGGNSFSGGRGSLWRTVLGALLIGILNNGLTLMNVNYNLQLVVKGSVIVLAVLLDQMRKK
ncbi:MAG: ribose import permease protein RbsC [Candidatus Kapaibacterium sp.]|jgi:ribose transport system permease protein|uniref:ABC transporter permease n=1 Tax=Caldilinea sp. TaxID=2293560 RepID=UPI0021DBBA8C|nr:MAG: ribose import permease protein RbsC [Candidatus Kapabacteria bacterium]